jgi:probable rRNA maturation factor
VAPLSDPFRPPESGEEVPKGSLIVHVNGLENWPEVKLSGPAVKRAVRATLELDGFARKGENSISFVGDDEIEILNRKWLGREGATDVIAFSLGGPDALLGDVYISVDTAIRNAAELGVSPSEELLRLVIHGTLHVAGHDHPDGAAREASDMYRLQEELLRSLGSG